MSKKRAYTIYYELDDAGYWVADVPSLEGCHAQGRSLRSAKKSIREVIDLIEGDGASTSAKIHESVHLDGHLARSLKSFQEKRKERTVLELAFEKQRMKLIQRLAERELSQRDIAEITGISHQRVDQLLKA